MGNLLRLLLQCAECLYAGGAVADDGYAFVFAICRFIPVACVQNLALKVVQPRDRWFEGGADNLSQ